jgi:hypothetical protein
MLRSSCLFIASFALLSLTMFSATMLTAKVASAQDPLMTQLYGSGVHAFFSGNQQQAY